MSRQLLRVLANFIINKSMSQIGIEHKYEQIKKNVRTMELKKKKKLQQSFH